MRLPTLGIKLPSGVQGGKADSVIVSQGGKVQTHNSSYPVLISHGGS